MNHSNTRDYCLLLGAEMNRSRALLAAARCTQSPIAMLQSSGTVNGNRYADLVIPGNPNNPRQALAAIRAFEQRHTLAPSSVVPLTEMTVQSGLAIAQHYSLPYMSVAAVAKARDKSLMKKAFRKANLAVPEFYPFASLQELKSLLRQLVYPVVLKPANAGGSEGVSLARDEQELLASYAHLTAATRGYSEKFGLSESSFQVEEYIDAPAEVSVEVINTPRGRQILAVTDKYLGERPYFVEMGHSLPSVWSRHAPLRAAALTACEALGIDRGIAHVELKILASGDPVLMEVNARTSGGCIPELFERVTGVSLFELHCQSYLHGGPHLPVSLRHAGRAAIAFLKCAPGTIAHVSVPQQQELPANVVALELWAKQGQVVSPCVDSNTRGEGFAEFYWPNDRAVETLTEHLETARRLTRKCLRVTMPESPAPAAEMRRADRNGVRVAAPANL